VVVDCDPIFIRDGRVWTSAGVTAGMDLALALVEDDLGPEGSAGRGAVSGALSAPSWQPVPVQCAAVVGGAVHRPDPGRGVRGARRPGARHGSTDLAARARLSPRHLQRRFTAELGVAPASYVEQVRGEAARRALAEADESMHAIARRCGFGTAETLRRVFQRRLGVAPSDYRDRFRITPLKESP
jgi:transcriptional regulator GlxA family with amidase domain